MSGWDRPIEDHEVPHLDALGAALRSMRHATGRSIRATALAATVSETHLGRIERGKVRTRRSTLERVVTALQVDDVATEVERLAVIAGPALAPESDWAWRVEARRKRRERRRLPEHLAAMRREERELERILRRAAPARRASIEQVLAEVRSLMAELEGEISAAAAGAREQDRTGGPPDG